MIAAIALGTVAVMAAAALIFPRWLDADEAAPYRRDARPRQAARHRK